MMSGSLTNSSPSCSSSSSSMVSPQWNVLHTAVSAIRLRKPELQPAKRSHMARPSLVLRLASIGPPGNSGKRVLRNRAQLSSRAWRLRTAPGNCCSTSSSPSAEMRTARTWFLERTDAGRGTLAPRKQMSPMIVPGPSEPTFRMLVSSMLMPTSFSTSAEPSSIMYIDSPASPLSPSTTSLSPGLLSRRSETSAMAQRTSGGMPAKADELHVLRIERQMLLSSLQFCSNATKDRRRSDASSMDVPVPAATSLMSIRGIAAKVAPPAMKSARSAAPTGATPGCPAVTVIFSCSDSMFASLAACGQSV
mmetsp:Transcript_23824/g.68770  ORF Transcript_23824/g.68770 Transcript_23824/m.68770 type:complete len:306 (-) Transcript_23824:280-1197(-)